MKAFIDPAGGSGGDSMTLAWAEEESGKLYLRGVAEKQPPFSPRATVEEFSKILKNLGLDEVVGDRYTGSWCAESFAEQGITYIPSARTKSQLYAAFLVLANSGLVQIPLHRKLIAQLRRLERRVMRGTGREQIDHPTGGRDDLSNAACGAIVLAHEEGAEPQGLMCEYISLNPADAPPKPLPLDWATRAPVDEERLWRKLE